MSSAVKNNSVDWVTASRLLLNKASVETTFKSVNPLLFNLNGLGADCGTVDSAGAFVYPPTLRLTSAALADVNWCLLDDGFNLYLYVLNEEWVAGQGVFEGGEWSEDKIAENGCGAALKGLVDELRGAATTFLNLYIVGPKESNWALSLAARLIEDEGGSFGFKMSYYDFYCSYLKGISKVF